MNIHEYQAKQILAQYRIQMPSGQLVYSADEAFEAASNMRSKAIVVKAQVHAGGRGKAGGVKIAHSPAEAREIARQMLGMTILTQQTGSDGKLVQKLYIEQGSSIASELYLSLVLDRATSSIAIIASTEGGVDIEEVAEHNPNKIHKVFVDTSLGLQDFHVRKVIFALGLAKEQHAPMKELLKKLYKAFIETDAIQLEINPLVIDKVGQLVPLDAKFDFDDNALYRQPEIAEMHDPNETSPLEERAAKAGLSYVKMDGDIGCMVNGAGLAMATMDIISIYGSSPANFLDVGGGASAEKVAEGFRIIMSDKNVKGILVNIFGGIMRCDIMANGIIQATKEVGINVPIVVRLDGTNSYIGAQILDESGLNLYTANNIDEAARKIVSLTKGK